MALGTNATQSCMIATALCLAIVVPALAATSDYGLGAAADRAGLSRTAITQMGVPEFIGMLIGIGLGFVGIIFFVLMLYGGYLWMTARGDEKRVEHSQDLIKDAIIGLVIVVSAYFISAFIFARISRPAAGPGSSQGSPQSCEQQCATESSETTRAECMALCE